MSAPPPDALRFLPVERSQADTLAAFGRERYQETFADTNAHDNLQAYLNDAFSPEQIARELADPDTRFTWVSQGEEIVGYMKWRLGCPAASMPLPIGLIAEDALFLDRFYLAIPWQGKGLGDAMMRVCLQAAATAGKTRIALGVWERNHRALAFYRRWGFEIIGTQPFRVGADLQTDYWMAAPVPALHLA